jgi:ketosteroid isomerase-like protein
VERNPPREPLEVVRGLYAATDGSAVLALVDPKVVWEVHAPPGVPFGGAYPGVEGTAAFLRAIDESIELLDSARDEMFAAGDRVVVLGRQTIRVKATGKTLTHSWVHLFRVKDGRILRFDEWLDSAKVLEAFRG